MNSPITSQTALPASAPRDSVPPAGAGDPSGSDHGELPQLRQEGLRALGEMASGMAHDFNNALSPIIGFCELLLVRPNGLRDEESAREYLRLMRTAAEDASHLVRRLRGVYLGTESGETLDPLDVNELIE